MPILSLVPASQSSNLVLGLFGLLFMTFPMAICLVLNILAIQLPTVAIVILAKISSCLKMMLNLYQIPIHLILDLLRVELCVIRYYLYDSYFFHLVCSWVPFLSFMHFHLYNVCLHLSTYIQEDSPPRFTPNLSSKRPSSTSNRNVSFALPSKTLELQVFIFLFFIF